MSAPTDAAGAAAVDLSVVIVTWNTRDITRACLDALFPALDGIEGVASEVIVVDNGSRDGTVDAIRADHPRAQVVANDANLGFAKAANQGLRAGRGRFRCLLNSDTVPNREAFVTLKRFLEETPRAGGATPQLLNEDGTKQNCFDNFPDLVTELTSKSLARLIWPGRYLSKRVALERPTVVDLALGACFLLRASALDEVGLLDEDYFFFQEDADLCFRLHRAGWPVYVVPEATLVHLQGKSKARAPAAAWIEYHRSMYLFFRKCRGPLPYAALRVFRPLKLLLNLLLNAIATATTLGLAERPRRKLATYATLVHWHLRLCPEGWGLPREAPALPPGAPPLPGRAAATGRGANAGAGAARS